MAVITLSNDDALIIGTEAKARLQYGSADSDAGAVLLDFAPGDTVGVPAFVAGVRIYNRDLGMFDGLTQPFSGVVDLAATSYVGFHHSAAATPVIRLRSGASGTVRSHALPDVASDTFVMLAAVQTLTNKALTAPTISTSLVITGTAAATLAVGRQGATYPVFNIDAATANVVTGLKLTGAAAGSGMAVAVTSSSSNESLTLDAKGTGNIVMQTVATGKVGVGTASPQALLHVAGQINFARGSQIVAYDAVNVIQRNIVSWNGTPDQIDFVSGGTAMTFGGTGSAPALYITAAQLVGMGNNAPGTHRLRVSGTTSLEGAVTIVGAGLTHASATLLTTTVALTNGAAAQVGTLTNAPTAGNPTKWIPVNDNDTIRYIPAW